MVKARGSATEHRQRLVDVLGVFVAGNDTACRIGLFDEVVAVVGENACARSGRFVNSSAEGIVLEANHATRAGQRNARQPLLPREK